MEQRDGIKQRAAGALMGAFVGEALGVGPHWFYDLDEQRRHYGDWIDDYVRALPGRYHAGLEPGSLSQSGLILQLMAETLVSAGEYDDADFKRRFERNIFEVIDGTAMAGPGGYTSQSVREAYRLWHANDRDWRNIAGPADTTEALERTLALGVRYALDLPTMAKTVTENSLLMQSDETVLSLTVAFNAAMALLIRGEPFDGALSGKLMSHAKARDLPFYVLTSGDLAPPVAPGAGASRSAVFASPDALLSPSYMARAALDPEIRIEPAWKVSLVYGMPCAIYHQLPAAYYLAARFADNFEAGVLHAINGGGQNQVRAMLTGALIGAQTGMSGIPSRFLKGLDKGQELQALAFKLAEQCTCKT